MQQNSSYTLLEDRLQAEIVEISRKMALLAQEKQALERLLVKARTNRVAKTEAVRKSSAARLIVERLILDIIEASQGKPVRSNDIFKQVKMSEYQMKAATFRSYLHRMKERGLIQNPHKRNGLWVLAEDGQKVPA